MTEDARIVTLIANMLMLIVKQQVKIVDSGRC